MLIAITLSTTGILINETVCSKSGKIYYKVLSPSENNDCHNDSTPDCCKSDESGCSLTDTHFKTHCCKTNTFLIKDKNDIRDHSSLKRIKFFAGTLLYIFGINPMNESLNTSFILESMPEIPKIRTVEFQTFYRISQTYPTEAHS